MRIGGAEDEAMGWLLRLYIKWHDRPDPAAIMQKRPVPVGRYDYEKAVAGAHKARATVTKLEVVGRIQDRL